MDATLDRLDRLDAFVQIGQLASRYAFAVDSRDFDALALLYLDDPGRRETVKAHFTGRLRQFYRTIHQVCGHQIDLVDADHARGRVYTRAEHEQGQAWIVMAVCYFDDYERRDGTWYFARRELHQLHVTSLEDRPRAPFTPPPWAPERQRVPEAWGPSWQDFWAEVPAEKIARLTDDPAAS